MARKSRKLQKSKNVETTRPDEDFRRQAEQPQKNLLAELLAFLLQNKKWWLVPIVLVLLLVALLLVLGGTGVAPFIYTLF